MQKKKAGKRAALTAAVTVVTAAGVMTGSLFDSPSELLAGDEPAPVVSYDVDIDGGDGDGTDAGDQDEERNGRRRTALRQRILRLPLAVRLLVILPLWGIGSGVTALCGALWTATSPMLGQILNFIVLAAALAAAFLTAAKLIFPDLPLKKILNKRTLPVLLFGAAALCVLNGVLSLTVSEYETFRQIVLSAGFLLLLGAASAHFALREQRWRTALAAAEDSAPALPETLTFIDPAGTFVIHR